MYSGFIPDISRKSQQPHRSASLLRNWSLSWSLSICREHITLRVCGIWREYIFQELGSKLAFVILDLNVYGHICNTFNNNVSFLKRRNFLPMTLNII